MPSDTRPPLRALLVGLLCASSLLSCQEVVETLVLPTDHDRQCTPDTGCRDDLLCVRLFIPKVITDGGFSESPNYTCHLPCEDDANCPMGYRCYMPGPPPMSKVCVDMKVLSVLQPPDAGM